MPFYTFNSLLLLWLPTLTNKELYTDALHRARTHTLAHIGLIVFHIHVLVCVRECERIIFLNIHFNLRSIESKRLSESKPLQRCAAIRTNDFCAIKYKKNPTSAAKCLHKVKTLETKKNNLCIYL
jgi:hypothetical protein